MIQLWELVNLGRKCVNVKNVYNLKYYNYLYWNKNIFINYYF
jgi:hypothetical protein